MPVQHFYFRMLAHKPSTPRLLDSSPILFSCGLNDDVLLIISELLGFNRKDMLAFALTCKAFLKAAKLICDVIRASDFKQKLSSRKYIYR